VLAHQAARILGERIERVDFRKPAFEQRKLLPDRIHAHRRGRGQGRPAAVEQGAELLDHRLRRQLLAILNSLRLLLAREDREEDEDKDQGDGDEKEPTESDRADEQPERDRRRNERHDRDADIRGFLADAGDGAAHRGAARHMAVETRRDLVEARELIFDPARNH
jgi:hypothetical protein